MLSSGYVSYDDGSGNVVVSYGSPDTYWNDEIAYFIGPPGSLGGFSNGVWDSYGYKTPYTGVDGYAFCVYPDGDVISYDDGVDDSYGRKSPIPNYSSYTCCVWSFGIIGSDHYVSNDSYGI